VSNVPLMAHLLLLTCTVYTYVQKLSCVNL